jgi:putative tryptophan/tyrosine transport system substrate-binding protein
MSGMRRREFITYLGGAAAWPAVAMGEQSDRLRRVGVLMGFGENDSEGILWLSSFIRAFRELGWTDGRNVRLEIRWGASDLNRQRMYARELVRLQPDVILAHGTSPTAAVQRETSTIPIVFAAVSDPVGEGFVESLPRPGANITGFIFTEAGMGGKWLELLKEIAPTVKRAAMIFNPDTAPGHGLY